MADVCAPRSKPLASDLPHCLTAVVFFSRSFNRRHRHKKERVNQIYDTLISGQPNLTGFCDFDLVQIKKCFTVTHNLCVLFIRY